MARMFGCGSDDRSKDSIDNYLLIPASKNHIRDSLINLIDGFKDIVFRRLSLL
jgi:hypothetical protein